MQAEREELQQATRRFIRWLVHAGESQKTYMLPGTNPVQKRR